jgi:signal transduction histidine kinase
LVTGDAEWLERLLLNLIDNAIKFTPPYGCIRVRVSSDRIAARLEVRDTGVGSSPDALPHLFERFYRVENGLSPRGAGLGLALAGWIADRHGATIGVTSRLGESSTFTVRLPLAFRAGSSSLTAQEAR